MSYRSNKYFSVSELNSSLKEVIEMSFSRVRVLGEVSQLKIHSSGHIYLTLKDEIETISVVCWKTKVPKLSFLPSEGKKVFITGKITTYSPQSKYQIIVDDIELEGEGSLLKILEERKKKLADAGYFDENKKKKIPFCPKSIGIITSPTGAVIRDIVHRIKNRFPVELILYPVHVQGNYAANEIIEGIKNFNIWKKKNDRLKCVDLIIIARGGGDLEDLMPFNEEILVKHIFNSEIPIISAVGHQTDTTLCDFASDLRASTPSTAAEIAVPVRSELVQKVLEKKNYLDSLISNLLDQLIIKLTQSIKKLPNLENTIQQNFQRLDFTELKLEGSIRDNVVNKKLLFKKVEQRFKPDSLLQKLQILKLNLEGHFNNIKQKSKKLFSEKDFNLKEKKKLLDSLSYKKVIKRGYTVIWKEKQVITKTKDMKHIERFEIEFADGKVNAKKLY